MIHSSYKYLLSTPCELGLAWAPHQGRCGVGGPGPALVELLAGGKAVHQDSHLQMPTEFQPARAIQLATALRCTFSPQLPYGGATCQELPMHQARPRSGVLVGRVPISHARELFLLCVCT